MMLLVWRGWGILILAFLGRAASAVTQLGVNAAMQDGKYYQAHGWPKVLGFWLAAAVCWPIGRRLNRGQQIDFTGPRPGNRSQSAVCLGSVSCCGRRCFENCD